MRLFDTSMAKRFLNGMSYSNKKLNVLGMQISSGNRLISPSIDPAGFAISRKMQAQIRGLEMASRNTQDGISLLNTADGALSTVNDMLIRIKELTVQAANDSNENPDRTKIQDEISSLLEEIDSVSQRTQYNKNTLLDGSNSKDGNGLWIQTGANAGQGIKLYLNKMDVDSLGLKDFDLTGKSGSEISSMIDRIDGALDSVISERSKIGANVNRMEYTINNLDTMSINLQDAHSRIADTDMAKAMMEYTKEQIRLQASTALYANFLDSQRQMISQLLSSM